tara:strand:- start:226 stop:426 length:201 start_codon:yes stop_codon:yes gene_type:complete
VEKEVGATGVFDEAVTVSCVARDYDYPIARFETIAVGLLLFVADGKTGNPYPLILKLECPIDLMDL